MAKKSSDAVDLEKGTAALKEVEKEEGVAIVDPQKEKIDQSRDGNTSNHVTSSHTPVRSIEFLSSSSISSS